MRNDLERHFRNNPWIFIAGIIAVVAAIFTIFSKSSSETLEVYNESNIVQDEERKEEEFNVDSFIYTYDDPAFSVSIPKDWQSVIKGGNQTFVHPASGSSIQFIVKDYDPSINNVTAASLSSEIAQRGMTFQDYVREDAFTYNVLYTDYQNSTYIYIDTVCWDTRHILTMRFICNEANSERIMPYYKFIANSFVRDEKARPPKGIMIYYNQNLNFEIGVPDSWVIGYADNAISAFDEETGATMTITAFLEEKGIQGVTATDVTSLLAGTKQNFMLNNFSNNGKVIEVFSIYVDNGVQIQGIDYFFNGNNGYVIMVSFTYENGMLDPEICNTCKNYYRTFASPESDTEKTDNIQ